MDPRKLQKILSDCDFDHDGKFTFDEFWAVMATVKAGLGVQLHQLCELNEVPAALFFSES